MTPELEQTINEAVRRMVDAVHPLRIVLFGSAARGELNEHSDLDFLVVVPRGMNRIDAAAALHGSLWGIPFPCDLVVVFEEEVEQLGHNQSLIIGTALATGKEMHHAA